MLTSGRHGGACLLLLGKNKGARSHCFEKQFADAEYEYEKSGFSIENSNRMVVISEEFPISLRFPSDFPQISVLHVHGCLLKESPTLTPTWYAVQSGSGMSGSIMRCDLFRVLRDGELPIVGRVAKGPEATSSAAFPVARGSTIHS